MRILNLYSGLGGNRKYWTDCEVVAVEQQKNIANIYQDLYPYDHVIIADAHQYLIENYSKFDFIWSSPPCQSHSKMALSGKNKTPHYPDLSLYEEILFLKQHFDGLWIVENVKPYYQPLIHAKTIGRHLFWSNFDFECIEPKSPANFIKKTNVSGSEELKKWLGIEYEGNIYYGNNHCPAQVLRNCVHPDIGKQIFDQVKTLKEKP